MDNKEIHLEVNHDLSIPKYRQLVNSIVQNIELGKIEYGQKLPSINQLSIDYYLSRDTVEKAYRDLKKKGVIESIKGKGYYVSNSAPETRLKILVAFNKISSYKKVIYNSLALELGEKAQIDFFIYHRDFGMFERIINEHLEGYHYYIIMPHFTDFDKGSFLGLMKKIKDSRLIILDHLIQGIEGYYGAVYQDFKMDIFNAMVEALDSLRKYKKLILVFPDRKSLPYPEEIVLGFKRFCALNQFVWEVIQEISEGTHIETGSAYVIIEENDLVNFIKTIRLKKLKLAKDVGVLSYNDTALKEVLAEGISVITTDFAKMGIRAADMILNQNPATIKNDFNFIKRESL